MVRILKDYDARRAEILQKAQQLFFSQGYEKTPINDILQALDISKGTFYHYFKSKEELLDAIIEEMTRGRLVLAEAILNDSGLSALEKINRFFADSKAFKYEHRALMMSLMRMMYSDENVLLRYKSERKRLELIAPVMARFVAQGVEEGVFDCPDPERTAEMLVSFAGAVGEATAQLILEHSNTPGAFELLLARLRAYEESFRRMLGAQPGALQLFDPLYVWDITAPEGAEPPPLIVALRAQSVA